MNDRAAVHIELAHGMLSAGLFAGAPGLESEDPWERSWACSYLLGYALETRHAREETHSWHIVAGVYVHLDRLEGVESVSLLLEHAMGLPFEEREVAWEIVASAAFLLMKSTDRLEWRRPTLCAGSTRSGGRGDKRRK